MSTLTPDIHTRVSNIVLSPIIAKNLRYLDWGVQNNLDIIILRVDAMEEELEHPGRDSNKDNPNLIWHIFSRPRDNNTSRSKDDYVLEREEEMLQGLPDK